MLLRDKTSENNDIIKDNEMLMHQFNARSSFDELEQRGAFDFIFSGCAQVIFIHGGPGTGKSTFIKKIISLLNDDEYILCAPTGIAALNIDGATIHSAFNIGFEHSNKASIYTSCDYASEKYEKLKYVIIDEISMVRCDLFDAIDQSLRKSIHLNEFSPFCGVKLILVGDMYQLPPIVDARKGCVDALKEAGYPPQNNSSFDFKLSKVYDELDIKQIEFKKQFRCTNEIFNAQLNHWRESIKKESLKEVCEYFNELSRNNYNIEQQVNQLKIIPYKETVEMENQNEFEKLDTECLLYTGRLFDSEDNECSFDILERYKFNDKNLPVPVKLELKIGTKVMCTKNSEQYVNGTMGIIEDLDKYSVTIKRFDTQKSVVIKQVSWDLILYDKYNVRKVYRYRQIPLILAWAVTIHRMQGATIEGAVITLPVKTWPSIAYVAISRLRNPDGLFLVNDLNVENARLVNFPEDVQQPFLDLFEEGDDILLYPSE